MAGGAVRHYADIATIDGGATPLDGPSGVALGPDGNLYAIDSGHDRVRVFDPSGKEVANWGKGGTGDGEFGFSTVYKDGGWGDIAFAPDGTVVIADPADSRIQRLKADGTFLQSWGGVGTEPGRFAEVSGVAVGSDGTVYATDYQGKKVLVFSADGAFKAAWDGNGPGQGEFGGPLQGPNDVAIDPSGRAWVTDDQNNRLYVFDPTGALVAGYGLRGYAADQFWGPWGIAIGPDGVVYVAEQENRRLHVVGPDGGSLALVGGPSGDPTALLKPTYPAVASDGTLYVSDTRLNQIVVLKPSPVGAGATPTG